MAKKNCWKTQHIFYTLWLNVHHLPHHWLLEEFSSHFLQHMMDIWGLVHMPIVLPVLLTASAAESCVYVGHAVPQTNYLAPGIKKKEMPLRSYSSYCLLFKTVFFVFDWSLQKASYNLQVPKLVCTIQERGGLQTQPTDPTHQGPSVILPLPAYLYLALLPTSKNTSLDAQVFPHTP